MKGAAGPTLTVQGCHPLAGWREQRGTHTGRPTQAGLPSEDGLKGWAPPPWGLAP